MNLIKDSINRRLDNVKMDPTQIENIVNGTCHKHVSNRRRHLPYAAAAAALVVVLLGGGMVYASNYAGLKHFFTKEASPYQTKTHQEIKSNGNTILLKDYLYDETGYLYLTLDCSKGPNLNAEFEQIQITLIDGEKSERVDSYEIVPLSEPNHFIMGALNTTKGLNPQKVKIVLDKQQYTFKINQKKLSPSISCPLDSGRLIMGLCDISVPSSSSLAKSLQREMDRHGHSEDTIQVTVYKKDKTSQNLYISSYSAGSTNATGYEANTHLQFMVDLDSDDSYLYIFDTKEIASITILGKNYILS